MPDGMLSGDSSTTRYWPLRCRGLPCRPEQAEVASTLTAEVAQASPGASHRKMLQLPRRGPCVGSVYSEATLHQLRQ